MARTREQNREYQRAYRARKKAESAAAKRQTAPAQPTAAPAKPPAPKPGAHRAAVTRMLKSTGLLHVAEEAPLVELVKSLAADLDAGAEGATASRYRAALADVRRVLAYSARPKSSSDSPPPAEEPPAAPTEEATAPVNSLAEFKAARGL